MARKHINMTTKLAAALLCLHPQDREDAKQMTASQYCSLFQFDHAELWALTANDHFTNLTPRLIAEHRQKSRRDTGIVAKVKRLEPRWAAFTGQMAKPSRPPKPRTKWASRPFTRRKK